MSMYRQTSFLSSEVPYAPHQYSHNVSASRLARSQGSYNRRIWGGADADQNGNGIGNGDFVDPVNGTVGANGSAINAAAAADANVAESCRVTEIRGFRAVRSVALVFVCILLFVCLVQLLSSPRFGLPALLQNLSVSFGLGGPSVRPSAASTQATQSSPLTVTSVRKAVLIGINYMGTPNELAGCIDDIRNVERLLRANGFSEIMVLSDVDLVRPTRANILSALKSAAAATKPGDVLFVHYSGHGGLLSAPSGVAEPEGKDSTLIPLDFYSAGHIKDYELRRDFINVLPAGSTLLLVVDACHSGTIADVRYTYSDASFREIAVRGIMGGFGFEDAGMQADDMDALGIKPFVELTAHKVAHLAAHYYHKKARKGAASPTPPKKNPQEEDVDVQAEQEEEEEKQEEVEDLTTADPPRLTATAPNVDFANSASATDSASNSNSASKSASLDMQHANGPASHLRPSPLVLRPIANRSSDSNSKSDSNNKSKHNSVGGTESLISSLSPSSSPRRSSRVAYHSPSRSPYFSRANSTRGVPKYAQYYKPDVSRMDHIVARHDGQKEFSKTQSEWKTRDVIPIEEPSYAPTAATVIVLSGCKDTQTSADTAFDSVPTGAATWALLCALCGTFGGTSILPISLRNLLKNMRGLLSSAGYTQLPQISAGTRIDIDTLTVRQLLKLDP